jgi:hypothetical protein
MEDGVPNAGVVKVGLFDRTTLPVPVEVVVPVPPLRTAIVVPFHTPVVIVPTLVKELDTTLLARVVPVKVPAGATTALEPAAVIRPLPLTVKFGIAVLDPKEPTFVLTVARVAAALPGPVAVTSPVNAVMPAVSLLNLVQSVELK